MISKDNLNFLKTKPEDELFHRSRIMFCIKDDKVEVAPKNIIDSHIEWFEKMGWIKEENTEQFLNKNIRGFYLPSQNKLYCYRGVGFDFDDKVLPQVLSKIADFKEMLELNNETEIYLGPKDSPISGKDYKRICAGRLAKLINK